MNFNTQLLHGKSVGAYSFGATLPSISQVSAYTYETSEQLEKVCQNKAAGFAYTRIGNPTVAAFERRICEMEGGFSATACASGLSTVVFSLLNILQSGDEIIASSGVFGGTIDVFRDLLNFGIKVHYVSYLSEETIAPLLNENTKAVFGEVISNPGLDVIDVSAVAAFVHTHQIPLILDSTTATPLLIRPLKLGADVVVHSSSKYINGSGNSIGGVIVDGGKFRWDPKRYPVLTEYKKFGPAAYTARLKNDTLRNFGSCMAPMNAYLNTVGLETMGLRVQKECENAFALAKALEQLPDVTVNYPLLETSPYQKLTEEQFGGYGGAILSLRVGSKERAYRLMNHLKFAHIATNIGDLRTLVIHPASTIYIHSTEEMMHAAGVYDDLIRVSVGIEDADDLIADFTQAIKHADEEAE